MTPRTAASIPDRLSSFMRYGLGVAVFNAVIAIFLTYVVHYGGDIATNMVYSQCIGLLIYSIINGLRLRLWPDRSPPILPIIVVIAVGVVAGHYFGTTFAGLLLGGSVRPNQMIDTNPLGAIITTLVASAVGTVWLWSRERMAVIETHLSRVREEAARAEADAERVRAEAARDRAENESAKRHLVESRLRLLQAQIEPHFLFNTLANLRSLISIDPPRALAMLDHFNDYLRATLSVTRTGLGTLKEEFVLLKSYLELLQIRMGSRLAYTLSLPVELEGTPLPPMLLQPLVENAVKHGLEPKVDGGRVSVEARLQEGLLVLRVADSGLGLAAGQRPEAGENGNSSGHGVGLNNVRERLRATYGPTAVLEMSAAEDGGAVAELRIPFGGTIIPPLTTSSTTTASTLPGHLPVGTNGGDQ